jgi:outer membrane protein TolC
MAPIVKHSRFWATAVALVVTAGCVNAPALKPEAIPASPAQLGLAPAGPATDAVWPAPDWWTRFDDAQLAGLIEAARSGNPNIKIAAARVRLAQQYERLAGSSDGPDLALNATATREKLSETYIYPPPFGGSTVTDGRVALDFSYEFDFWGRTRALLASAGKQTEAARAEQEAARLVLSIAVARTYFQLQERYEALDLAQDMLRQRQAVVQLVESRARNGLDSKAEIDPNAAAAASVRQDIASLY